MKSYRVVLRDGRQIDLVAAKYALGTKENFGKVVHFYGDTTDKTQPETFVNQADIVAVISEECGSD